MKKIAFIFLFIFNFCLCSCQGLYDLNSMDDHEYCDKIMENLTTYLSTDNKTELKRMFASKLYSSSSFEDDLEDLINYYDGECNNITGRVTTGEYSNYDYEEKHYGMEYTVLTSVDTFRFRLFYVKKDSRDENSIGITRLYVLKLSEDEYPNDRYVGALVSEDGIHVAYPHEKKEEIE